MFALFSISFLFFIVVVMLTFNVFDRNLVGTWTKNQHLLLSLVGLEPIKLNKVCSSFMESKVLSQIYNESFGVIFSIYYHTTVCVTVLIFYVLFNSTQLPMLMLIPILVAQVLCIMFIKFLLTLVTESHLLSKELIRCLGQKCCRLSPYPCRYWRGMRPLKVQVVNFFSFETRELLLKIWGEIVLVSAINLLIAF